MQGAPRGPTLTHNGNPTMENLSLTDAYRKLGATSPSRAGTLSAMSTDGALVLTCMLPYFRRPARGVLRYEDHLTRDGVDGADRQLLGRHLTRAREEGLPVRMVVLSDVTGASGRVTRNAHVRTDLIGKVTAFDGDHFIIDFTRVP
jgi:hypothetical protein